MFVDIKLALGGIKRRIFMFGGDPGEGQGTVKNILSLSTVPLYATTDDGMPVEPTPGSGVLVANLSNVWTSQGISVFHVAPTKKPEGWKNRSDVKVIPFGASSQFGYDYPIYTQTSGSSKQFSGLTPAQWQTWFDVTVRETFGMAEMIDTQFGGVQILYGQHAGPNMAVLAQVNRIRMESGKSAIPIVLHLHGTELKLFEQEQGLLALGSGLLTDKNVDFSRAMLAYLQVHYSEVLGSEDLRLLTSLTDPKIAGFRQLSQTLVPAVGGMIAISPEVQGKASAVFPGSIDEIKFIPNGFDNTVFTTMDISTNDPSIAGLKSTPGTGSQSIPFGEADHIIVFVGKFAEWKGLGSLLHAAQGYEKRFADAGKKVLTVIIGTGGEKEIQLFESTARELGLQNTYFLGQQPAGTIAKVLNLPQTAFGIFPSKNEPFGLVAVECMGCGKPVISGTGGFELFVDETNGRVLRKPHDAGLIEATVIEAIENNWQDTKGPNASKTASKFSIAANAQKVLDYFKEIIGRTDAGEYDPGIVRRWRVPDMVARVRQLYLSPQALEQALISLSTSSFDASVPARLAARALVHGGAPTIEGFKRVGQRIMEMPIERRP